jgi:hypothetical protein
MVRNGQLAFEKEFDAIIAELSTMGDEVATTQRSTKKERLLDALWDLIRSPYGAIVDDKASHLIEVADVLCKIDPL